MKRQEVVQTMLECEDCGFQMPIFRKQARQKKKGHIKHMYCPNCRKTKAFIEQKERIEHYDE